MINWKLDPVVPCGGQLTLFDYNTGAMVMIRFTDPDQLRRMLGDILEGTQGLAPGASVKDTPLPDCVKRAFPERD